MLFSAVLLNKPFVVLPLLSHPGSFPDPQLPPQPPHPRYLQSHRHALRSFPQRTCVLPFSSRTTASSTSSWSIWASLPSTSPYDSLSPPPQTEKARYISEVYSTLPTYDVFTDSYFLARRSHRHYLSSLATYDYLLPHASLPVVSPSLEPIPLVDSNLFPTSFFRSSLLPRPPAKPLEELDHTPLLNPPKSAKAGPMAVSGTQVVPMEIESTQDLARSDSSPNSDVELSYTDSLDEKSSMSSQSLVLLADSPEESFVSVPSRSFHQAIEAGDASGVKRSSFICIDANVIVTVRRCRICHIFMPPRSFHCRMCDWWVIAEGYTQLRAGIRPPLSLGRQLHRHPQPLLLRRIHGRLVCSLRASFRRSSCSSWDWWSRRGASSCRWRDVWRRWACERRLSVVLRLQRRVCFEGRVA